LKPRIVIDLGGLDGLWPGAGLFRYAIDLVRALHSLRLATRFYVFGSFPTPIAELAPVFAGPQPDWVYRYVPRITRFPAELRRHWATAMATAAVRADLYHCLHTFVPLPSPCPTVVTIQDLMYELFPEYQEAIRSRSYRLLRWSTQRRARRIICPSQATAADLGRMWRIAADRIDVVHHGLRVFGPHATNAVDRPSSAALTGLGTSPVIVSQLNLEPRKNLNTLLEAYARLPSDLKETRLVLFGRGGWNDERAARYRSNLARLGLDGRIIEAGVLCDEDLGWLYRRAALFVFPTLYEGFGYPALEAMAAGTCPIVRDVSSMAEVVGDAGVRIEPFTSERLADTISDLLRNDARRAAYGSAAKARAAAFTSNRMARQTLATYSKAIGRGTVFDQVAI
jgi:glycosyltransferase involved in cell wall biosynthesis